MSLIVIFTIILVHWFGDFVIQTDEQAKNKSKDNSFLLAHVSSYSITWLFIMPTVFLFSGLSIIGVHKSVLLFLSITFVTHFITDYFTSRLNSKLLAKGDVHNFFVSVGFDQVLHYVQLFLTYKLCLYLF
jgi:hypothetical protein